MATMGLEVAILFNTIKHEHVLREFVFNSRHPDPRRVLGRCRAAVHGQDPADPRMGSFLRVLGVQNNEHEHRKSEKSILLCFFLVFVIDFSFSQCFTTILDAFLLKSCSKAAPAALGGCG